FRSLRLRKFIFITPCTVCSAPVMRCHSLPCREDKSSARRIYRCSKTMNGTADTTVSWDGVEPLDLRGLRAESGAFSQNCISLTWHCSIVTGWQKPGRLT